MAGKANGKATPLSKAVEPSTTARHVQGDHSHDVKQCSFCGERSGVIQRCAQGSEPHGLPRVDEVLRMPGQPLAPAVRTDMERRLGADFSMVRVHSGEPANRSSKAVGALAYTSGTHIVFRDGTPDTATWSGRALLAHELAHVIQQDAGPVSGHDFGGGLKISEPGDPFERQAEATAARAMRQGPISLADTAYRAVPARAGTVLQRFEAPKHEAIERVGLTTDAVGSEDPAGFSNEEASAVYFGNWMRDLNQVFVPMALQIMPADILFSALAFMAAKKFGRNMTPEQFGYYIPAEHIDSPAGLTYQDDLLPGPPAVPGAPPVPGAQARPAWAVTEQQHPEPAESVQRQGPPGRPGITAPLFSVDQAGVLAYIRRTNLHVERRLELAVQRGRTTDGLLHFGAALHAVEDLFAHSNWVEIAVNKVLAEHPDLLPQLHATDRVAFPFLPSVDVGGGPQRLRNRPVLTTGSFIGADTKISLTSEFVKFLEAPLPEPQNNAEAQAEERFIEAELRSIGNALRQNPQFRNALRQTILEGLGPYGRSPFSAATGPAVDRILQAPVADIYHLSTMLPPIVPDAVKDVTTRRAQRAIRTGIHDYAMVPAARRFQAEALGAQVADTSLIVALREARARQSRTSTPPAELETMEARRRFTGQSVQDQERAGREEATRRERNLQATPEATVAGPSHSQISKDHANSPFFGLAFHIASIAVRRLREKLVAAWTEAHGATAARRIVFDPAAWPGGSQAEQDARDLFEQTRSRRAKEESESRAAGLRTITRGNEVPGAFDLAAMRRESADQIRGVTAFLRAAAGAPDQASTALDRLRGWLGTIAPDDPGLAKVRRELDVAAQAARQAGQTQAAVGSVAVADQLDAAAALVGAAVTQQQRQAANEQLVRSRNAAVQVLATTPSAQGGAAAAALLVLDQQIADTAPTFRTEQRDVAEGRAHIAEHTGPRTYSRSDITLPSLDGRPAALRRLLEESRVLVNHPYESTWWEADVIAHIRAHSDQIATDIAARTTGVPVLRRPGQTRAARQQE